MVRKFYRDTVGSIWELEADGSQDHLIGDKVAMSAEEIEAHINPVKSAEQIQAEVNAEAKAYLASTDWYVVRQAETGVVIPTDVVTTRVEARLKIVGA